MALKALDIANVENARVGPYIRLGKRKIPSES
jgi:hypothetical protein